MLTDHSKKIKLVVHELIKGVLDVDTKLSITHNSVHLAFALCFTFEEG